MVSPPSGTLRTWLRRQQWRWTLRRAGVTSVAGSVLLLGLSLLHIPELPRWQWGVLDGLLLVVVAWAAWLGSSPERLLPRIAQRDYALAEALRTELELASAPSGNELHEQFREQHRQQLESALQNSRNRCFPRWHLPWLIVVVVQGVLVFSLLHGVPNFRQLAALVSTPPEIPQTYRLLFPAYLNRPPEVFPTLPDSLEVPQGSRLELTLLTAPPSDDESRFSAAVEFRPLRWLAGSGRWSASLTLENSGTLRLDWRGQTVEIQVRPDEPPLLVVTWPSLPHIFDMSTLPVDLLAEDDHALKQIVLHYRIASNGRSYREIVQSFEDRFPSHQELFEWSLSASALRAGDNVTAWVEASDQDTLHGPHVTRSGEFTFVVESQREFHEEVLRRLRTVSRRLRELVNVLDLRDLPDTEAEEQRILGILLDLAADAPYDPLLSEQLRGFIEELRRQLRHYQQQREQVAPKS